ncbi:hypothetical protein [Brevundimonas sp.]|uniref:hypothetical protein n=1 Tax=Brevundimonas sp. TaxID=1871086 RepID=UPI002D63F596|nr:hypothetical protein [Brevundimonas sp.]HYC66600.1 hypothetical protein [Brevundimonas sp.]
MAFSATEAAFEGFRLVRRNPLVLVAWTVLYAVVSLAALFAMAPVVEQLVGWQEEARTLREGAEPGIDAVWSMMAEFGGIMIQMAWLIPVAMVVEAMMAAAVARGVLRPRNGAFGYLSLGMDEVRVLVVTFVLGLFMILACVAVSVAFGVVVAAARSAGAGGWIGLIVFLGLLAGVWLLIWLAVRLSLAVPITVAEQRFAFFDSFALTKGRFWPLLGMAVIAIVMVIIIELLSSIVSMPVGVMSGLESPAWGSNPSPEHLRAMLDSSNPWVILSVVIESVVKALTVGVIYAPFAAAYRGIKGAQAPAG